MRKATAKKIVTFENAVPAGTHDNSTGPDYDGLVWSNVRVLDRASCTLPVRRSGWPLPRLSTTVTGGGFGVAGRSPVRETAHLRTTARILRDS